MTVSELKQFLQFYRDDAIVSIRYLGIVEDSEGIVVELAKSINVGAEDLEITGESIEDESATGIV